MFKIVGIFNYLAVVFLNAFTDLGHKIIIQNTIFKVYNGSEQIILTAIVNALILLPFILPFTPSGYLADKFAKNIIMKYSAIFAVFITLLITYSYYSGYFYMAFILTFVLASQSAIYAPAKYGFIKELVGIKYISAGNASVQAVTTISILLGIITYTLFFEYLVGDIIYTKEKILQIIAPLSWLLVLGSLIEYYLASKIPNKMKRLYKKRFIFKKYIKAIYLKKNMIMLKRKEEIFQSIISLGLFWSISQVILAIFPQYVKSEIEITNTIVVQGLMVLAVFGIVFGSILAAKFSRYYINTGLTSIGAIGITILVLLIPNTKSLIILSMIFIFFGVFSGFIIVPLNSKIQSLAPNIHLGTILAGNNFLQTVFMFMFLMLTTFFAYIGISTKILFYMMAFTALILSIKLLKRYFIMTFWMIMELVLKTRHTYKYIGLENIPQTKAVLLLGNHVSWIDWFIVQLPIQRRINFMLERNIYEWKFFHILFKLGKIIPISPKASKDSFKEASIRLKESNIVALYPEGCISKTQDLGKFHRGYELIDKHYNGIIVPYFIDGIFGSIFSKCKKAKKKSFFQKREITIYFGKALPKDIKANELREIVKSLKA